MSDRSFDIGMVGLGVMGRNFLLNMADHGFSVIGLDRDKSKVDALASEGAGKPVEGVTDIKQFVKQLKRPRALMMLVPAGKPVDAVIDESVGLLDKDDIIIDGGNSHFTDTNRHASALSAKGINFLGIGISGGEKGARFGPSMMPGGPEPAYKRVQPIFEAAAAHVDGSPCVTYLGPGSAGHYVKMVHNGIEYALMALLAETYDLLRRGVGLSNDELADLFAEWDETEVKSFLVEIAEQAFRQQDDQTEHRLIDMIRDRAKQKGTGKWTSQDAMELQVPVPTIDSAVEMRDMSGFKEERESASEHLKIHTGKFAEDKGLFKKQLHRAFHFAMITAYAQGMALLKAASEEYKYGLNLEDVARIWRGGCIIRADLLENIRTAMKTNPNLPNLMVDPHFGKILMDYHTDLRETVRTGVSLGIPVTSYASSLGYFDSYRSAWLPANLIQALRDNFGSHTYERIDRDGIFHTEWGKDA
jgi:6-phosphogluconate dehydrogenase